MEPTLAEIRLFAGTFAPRGWAFCDGQLLPINANQALFSIIGTIYGGDGRTTFALPDLRGRAPLSPRQGSGLSSYREGARGGAETVTVTTVELPSHTHGTQTQLTFAAPAAPSSTTATPDPGARFGQLTMPGYSAAPATTTLAGGPIAGSLDIAASGGQRAHENRQPLLALNYIIALQGIFPSRG